MSADWSSFYPDLLATAIGVAAGIAVGLAIDRWKKHNESIETRNKFIDSVIAELKEDIKKGVEDFLENPVKWDENTRKFTGHKPHTLTPAFDSLVNSGNYGLLHPYLQKILSNVYLRVEVVVTYSNQIRNFHYEYASRITDPNQQNERAVELCDKVKTNIEKINVKLQFLLQDLEDFKNGEFDINRIQSRNQS